MCGRFERSSPIERIASKFNITQARLIVEPSYNIAPSQNILVIIEQGTRQFMSCRWGFIPSWAKDPSIGHKMINDRAEIVRIHKLVSVNQERLLEAWHDYFGH